MVCYTIWLFNWSFHFLESLFGRWISEFFAQLISSTSKERSIRHQMENDFPAFFTFRSSGQATFQCKSHGVGWVPELLLIVFICLLVLRRNIMGVLFIGLVQKLDLHGKMNSPAACSDSLHKKYCHQYLTINEEAIKAPHVKRRYLWEFVIK